jgi:two-component system, cell cycle response regulator
MIGKVLIVDDVATNRIVFRVKLTAAGYQTVMATDGAGCLGLARSERPDLILLDYGLPDMAAIEVLTELRAHPLTRRMPVVVFSADSDPLRRLAALRAGADDYLMKPIDDQTLFARLRNLLRAQAETDEAELAGLAEGPLPFDGPGLVAVVTNRSDKALKLQREIAEFSQDRLVHVTPDMLFEETVRPDVYLIEADVSGEGSGLRLMSELLSRPASRHAACFMLYDRTPPFAAAMAYDLGAHDLADMTVTPAEMALRLTRLVRRKREADAARAKVQDGLRLAIRDHLTGLHNRRYAMPQLQVLARQAAANHTPLAVMLVDLDRFKSVNDRFGHAAGDAVLIEVARRLADALRAEDLLARVGGEEFLVVLPETGIDQAKAVAARLCQAVKDRPILLPAGQRIDMTASIGLTIASPCEALLPPEALQGMIDRADVALLAAKNAGRNQVTVARSAA